MPASTLIWGWIMVATMPSAPDQAPSVLFDYKTEELCMEDKAKLAEDTRFKSWCIPVPKPEKNYQRRATKKAITKKTSRKRVRRSSNLTMTQIVKEHGL